MKKLGGEGVDLKCDRRTHSYVPGVGFIGCCKHLHAREVLRDGEHVRGLQRRGHGLAHVDVASDNRALNGREDGGVEQIGLGLLECALHGRNL